MANFSDDFFRRLDSILGFYLDSTMAYHFAVKQMETIQLATIAKFRSQGEKWTLDRLDALGMIIGKGDPNTPEAQWHHVTTQGEFKARNRKEGHNYGLIGNSCAILVYQYWEDHFRGLLAGELGLDADTIQIDIMGDLRLIRNSIIHNDGSAIPEITRCRVIKWFQPGDPIQFTQQQFVNLMTEVAESVIGFLRDYDLPENEPA